MSPRATRPGRWLVHGLARVARLLVPALAILSIASCGSGNHDTPGATDTVAETAHIPTCVPHDQQPCVRTDGTGGYHVCTTAGTWGPCLPFEGVPDVVADLVGGDGGSLDVPVADETGVFVPDAWQTDGVVSSEVWPSDGWSADMVDGSAEDGAALDGGAQGDAASFEVSDGSGAETFAEVDATGEVDVADEVTLPCPPGCATYCLDGICQPCPADMALVADTCMDKYEAPNVEGGLPLVMYTYVEAKAWCEAKGKRLCLDTEWQGACEGPDQWAYPYGPAQVPGVCNDEETWLVYSQTKLNGWPSAASSPSVESYDELIAAAMGMGPSAVTAAEHIEELYQAEPSGSNTGCVNGFGVFDLTGNVEEWTERAEGATESFHGNLKGRYWAETRTCQQDITTHGDFFRFYEIGFRCCKDAW